MTFQQALKILNIEDYSERIYNSNSHGELFHLYDYIILAKEIKKQPNATDFRKWFEEVVKYAEQHWRRPESVFQHILKIISQ